MNLLTDQRSTRLRGNGFLLYLLPTWLVLLVSLRICLPHRIDHILLTLLASVVVSILWFFGLKSSLLPSLLQTRSPTAEANRDQRAAPVVAWGIAASVAVMLLLLVFGGVRHDYQSYMEQWAVINAGNIPWTDKSNTYLPLHSFLAPLASVHPLLVKLLFAVTALLTIAISSFGRIAGKEHFGRHEKSILFIATALCPFTLVMSFWLGLNDALTGSLLFIATILAAHYPGNFRNQFLAGALLAMGACIKIYPLLTAPFFLIRQKRIQWSFAAGCLTTLILIFGISFYLWGEATLTPFNFAASRGTTFISPFNALYNSGFDLTRFSTPTMIIALGACLFWYIHRNIDFASAVMMGLGITLFFYRVGHINYLAFIVFATPYMIRHWSATFNPVRAAKLTTALLMWVSFLNWYQLQYMLNCGMTLDTPSRVFRDHGAWPYAIVILLAFRTFHRYLTPSPRRLDMPIAPGPST